MKKKVTKKKTSTKRKAPKHYVHYVFDSCPKVKEFKSIKNMKEFIHTFQNAYPDVAACDTGCWIDYYVTNVRGEFVEVSGGLFE